MSGFLSSSLRLDEWLLKQEPGAFPNDENYPSRYSTILDYLKKDVYREIEKGAIIDAAKKGYPIVYLTNHGEAHVNNVMTLVSQILKLSLVEIEPYEAYIILIAILIHDVGNVLGREEHEKKIENIINSLGAAIFPDVPETRVIMKIASAHGGRINGDKDTLNNLESKPHLRSKIIRKRFLASLLRFADELADDQNRASRFMFENGLLEGSEIYHAYSLALKSVLINPNDITLRFEFDKETAIKELQKNKSTIFLLDEIFQRTLKMHFERIYCMRHCRAEKVDIACINVDIKIYESFKPGQLMKPPIEQIFYKLEEKGYPNFNQEEIFCICPGLKKKTGRAVKDKLSGGSPWRRLWTKK